MKKLLETTVFPGQLQTSAPAQAAQPMADRYSIYADRSGRLTLHCSGFSWIAALYPPLWAVPRRLWLACLGWLAISLSAKALLLALLFQLPLLGAAGGIYIGAILIERWAASGIYLGAILIERWVLWRFANSFHRWWLQRHGYVLIAAAPPAQGAAAA